MEFIVSEENNGQPNLPTIHSEMNLGELAEALVAFGDNRIALTEEQQFTIRTLILRKVDNCTLFHREVEDEIKRNDGIAAEFSNYANSLRKKLANFDTYVTNVMLQSQLEKLPGEKFEINLKKSTYCDMPNRQPTEQDFEVMGPEFVRRTEKVERSWNKVEITRALKNGTFPFENIGQIKERYKPEYEIKKGRV